MLDRGEFWAPAVSEGLLIRTAQLEVELLAPLHQIMLSGDLAAGLARYGLSKSLGLMAGAQGETYALRLARGRMLIVGAGTDAAVAGWSEGIATTPMTGALAVLELRGEGTAELIARATPIDLCQASPCAALNFAGVTSVLYRHEGAVRLHLDRGLVSYMADWIRSSGAA